MIHQLNLQGPQFMLQSLTMLTVITTFVEHTCSNRSPTAQFVDDKISNSQNVSGDAGLKQTP